MTSSGRILVIDDSTTVRKLVEIAFRTTSIVVDFAASGAEGIRSAIARPPDAILLDFVLPDMRGVDVCARLAQSGAAAVPVVVMSAKREGVKEAFRGMPSVVDVMAKPFSMEEIRDRVSAAMRARVITPLSPSSPPSISVARTQTGAPQGVAFSGDLAAMPLLDALRFIGMLQLTGCLTLELSPRLEIFARDGDVVMCASHGPPAAVDLDHAELAHVPRAAIERAAQEQARTGKPVAALLAEAGHLPRDLAPLALREQGARLLAGALEARAGTATWRTLDALPDHVEAFGRPQAVTGLALEQRRRSRSSEVVPPGFLDAVYERTARFSRRLAGARLSGSEQKLLALLDGKTPMYALLERAGLAAPKAASVCARLAAVDLIELRDHASVGSFGAVALWTEDGDFERALRGLLHRRTPPLELIDLTLEGDLAGAIMRSRPRLILAAQPSAVPPARLVDAARLSTSTLVAVLDTASRAAIDACLGAGFHAALAKPIHQNDLERLLVS